MDEPEDLIEIPYIKCPFCQEDDFDLPGLKHHLLMYCEAYRNTEDIV